MKRLIAAATATLVAALVTGLAAGPQLRAAEPGGGSVADHGDTVAWDGQFSLSNPAVCTGPSDPTCDHFLLEVQRSEPGFVVDVEVAAEQPTDDIDLFVYDATGRQVGKSGGEGGTHRIALMNPPAGTYEVRVQPFAVAEGARYDGTASLTVDGNDGRLPIDHGANGCLEPVPAHVGVPGVTGPGRIDLDVLVLVDGLEDDGDDTVDDDLTFAEVERDLALAQEHTYGPVGIDLRTTLERVHFPSDGRFDDALFGVRETAQASRLMADAKAHVGGYVPDGYDIVWVATAKDLYEPITDEGYSVMGLADCIGGVRFADSAFAVGEAGDAIEGDFYLFGLGEPTPKLLNNASAKVFAHEVGHLMGNHHHYGQCAEGTLNTYETLEERELSPCTLMYPDATLISLSFGAVERAVTRGHAEHHAH